jgi:phosphatidylserine decarboxylase
VRIAPEGRPFVALAGIAWVALAAFALALGGWWWISFALWSPVALWIPWFFRDPPRPGPRGSQLIIAPADGKVVGVVAEEEPSFVAGPTTRVSIFMSVFDVHVNRHPVSGTVAHRHYEPGAFVNATRDKASEANERMSLGIRTERGPVLVRQIAGLIARRIVTDAPMGAVVVQGERLGMIRFGSRVDTFLPAATRVLVSPGDRTRAGATPIAEWQS